MFVLRFTFSTLRSSDPFTMNVSPSGLGGVFSWMPTGCGCTLSGSGTTFSWNCSTNCTCCGTSADGTYAYEGYWLPATTCPCGCHYDGEGPTWTDDNEDPDNSGPFAASVYAAFSTSAVIFEDAYENEPGQWVGKRSTRTRLNLVAHGGPNGAALSVAATNLGKLSRISGPDLPLASVALPANTSVSYAIVYEGADASGAADDVVVTTTLTENGTGTVMSDFASVTSLKVELCADNPAPLNSNPNRHVYGVLESLHYRQYPADVAAEWIFWEDTESLMPFSQGYMILPATTNQTSSGRCRFSVTSGGVSYTNAFQMYLPQIEARNPRCNSDIVMVNGESGWLLLHLDLYVGPAIVSFKGLDFQEIPDESGNCPHTGYYNDVIKGGYLSHCAAAGAGIPHEVALNGYWCSDKAGKGGRYEMPWCDGWKEWPIPVGWGASNTIQGQFDRPPTTQKFTLMSDGTFSISKYGFEATRDTSNNITGRRLANE